MIADWQLMNEVTPVLTHFGDSHWVNLAIKTLKLNENCQEILVLDNSGNLQLEPDLKKDVEVVSTASFVDYLGSEQHGRALNYVLRNFGFKTKYVMILDSDVILIDEVQWGLGLSRLQIEFDALVSIDPGSRYLTHACFMVFRADIAKELDLTEGMSEFGFDTARLCGLQLRRMGQQVKKLTAIKNPLGRQGYYYHEIGLLHFGSGSLGYLAKRFSPNGFRWNLVEILKKECH